MSHIQRSFPKTEEVSTDTVISSPPKPEKNSVLGVLMLIILDTFRDQLYVADIQSKSETQNAACQQQMINNMEHYHLRSLPQDIWQDVPIYTRKFVRDSHGNIEYDMDGHALTEKVIKRITCKIDGDRLHPIEDHNRMQLQMRMDCQCALSVLGQHAQLGVTDATATLQGSTQTSSLSTEMWQVVSAIVKKISTI